MIALFQSCHAGDEEEGEEGEEDAENAEGNMMENIIADDDDGSGYNPPYNPEK